MEICIIRSATAKCSQFLFLPFTVQTRLTPILIIKDLPNPLFLLFFFSFFKTKARSRKANTHKDNNEIPLRAKEGLPGNRKDFSTCQRIPLSRSESGGFLYKENHRQCRWYQKALAMPGKNIRAKRGTSLESGR